ncbi:hypothetical protein PILCRDRAFT_76387 [Piloderma croceum F 1598]|uniref:Uncharacterized protein n=1 Tax=Piloderma croceum (strain F 1598) TaxID=765440 RepID=A0A0C3AUY2_PILCF|nr:hypothetical protein PILCRDRAFT_76387 [Piloderma croceum F 1598]
MELVVGIIRTFSPRALSTERRIGPGYVQRPPEAQYQDEFYRCCHNVSKGSLVTFPEFGTKRGRVDFYIPSKQWGVELLRNGDRLEQHSGRFSQTGSYGTSLIVSDYIILDCRTTYPMKLHSHLPKLHHVVFADNFRSVRILNNKLELVPSGEFTLLASS